MTHPEGLHVHFSKRLTHISLEMQFFVRREILVLFGPSGSGKTQTLNVISGLSHPDQGLISIDGMELFQRRDSRTTVDVPARDRRIGYVFQSYALFPHLTALENVGYSIRKRSDREPQSRALLARMHLADLAQRYPNELSGGQQQRVAIARALAAEPRVLLLDEPFSALDHSIREELHEELCRIQEESQLSVIYVTHNLDDALAVSHRLAVVNNGRVVQIDSGDKVIAQPATREIAGILGLPNVLDARVIEHTSGGTELDWEGVRLRTQTLEAMSGELVSAFIHPGNVRLNGGSDSGIRARYKRRHPGRSAVRIVVELPNGREIELLEPSQALKFNDVVDISIPRESVQILGKISREDSKTAKKMRTREAEKPRT